MKVKELVEQLAKIDPELEVVIFDNEWKVCDRAREVRLLGSIELITDPPTHFQTPIGEKIEHADIVNVNAVEIIT